MAATGITAVKDALVARIDAAWITLAQSQLTPPTATETARHSAQDEVLGVARVDAEVGKQAGRKVYVFRAGRADEPASRGHDQYDYTLVVWVVERYTDDQIDPPEAWIDERVAWLEWLLVLIGSVRTPATGNPLPGLWPQSAEITQVYDPEDLTEHKVLSSILTVAYREIAGE